MKLVKIIFLLLVCLIVTDQFAEAQCAMCRATVESSTQSSGPGQGLNAGILYLMSIPYLIFACIAFFWYRNSVKESGKEIKLLTLLKKKAGALK